MKKNKLLIPLMALTLAAGTFAFTQAYFTDQKTITNTFEIGSVEIDLLEPSFEAIENAIPAKQYDKDPQVTNVGENDAFVYLEVRIPTVDVICVDENGNKLTSAMSELFTMVDLDLTKWEPVQDKRLEGNETVYVYGYKEKLGTNETTSALFSKIQFANLIEGQTFDQTTFEESTLNVNVKAMAIQAEETGTMLEAYNKYIAQNS